MSHRTRDRLPREEAPETRDKTLFVGNLDRRVTERHLISLFTQFGELERVLFMWHWHGPLKGQPRGFAFVEFKKKEDALLACQQANGVDLAGRPMVVKQQKDKAEGGDEEDFKPSDRRKPDASNRGGHFKAGSSRGGYGGGGGGYGGGGMAPRFDPFKYVPAAIPSSGLGVTHATTDAGVLGTALAKVRAIEDKLRAMEEERLYERRLADRGAIVVDPHAAEKANQREKERREAQQAKAFAQTANPNRQDYVHTDRRGGGGGGGGGDQRRPASRERSRSRSRDRSGR